METINSYIKAIKYILSIALFKESQISKMQYEDDYYNGLDSTKTIVRIFKTKKSDSSQSIIIFPGASPYAEEHPSVLMLANALCYAGYDIYLPRIPDLKRLEINLSNIDWFAHAYNELVTHKIKLKKNIMVAGLSFGGATLLKASQDERMKNPKPHSILTYGTYYSMHTALNFFITQKISYKNKEYIIKPHEWGIIVLFYNFIETTSCKYNLVEIKKILKARIEDKFELVDQKISKLQEQEQTFIKNIIEGKMTDEISSLAKEMVDNNQDILFHLSPENWAKNIDSSVFVIHGANDSMVPFTESYLLDKNLKNSSLFISFLYEHRELATNKGIFFKLKELIRMIHYFAKYFKFNI